MRSFVLTLYSVWSAFWFLLIFLLIFPFQYLFLQKEQWKPMAHQCNRIWGLIFFSIIRMPILIRYQGKKPDEQQAYVFASNHFSYLDIAAMMVLVKNYFAFVGKSALKRAPLFGYMFAKLHIQVDRADPQSRSKSLQRSLRALANGRSIMIYPEGGIRATNPPQMDPHFKDGAFRMAIRQQVPLVPISLLNNHQLLPDIKKVRLHPGKVRAVIHEPIDTKGMTEADVEPLKKRVFDIIQSTLDAYAANPGMHDTEFTKLTL